MNRFVKSNHEDDEEIEGEEDRLEEDEVWSDGQHVYIARQYPLVDRLRPLPLKRIRTDPSWLLEKIANYRTDDLAIFGGNREITIDADSASRIFNIDSSDTLEILERLEAIAALE